jgi:GxxExxY protein
MLRVHSELSPTVENLALRVIGCCIAVHRELGPGLVEAAYLRAVRYELAESRIPYEYEKRYPIQYRGRPVYVHRLDLVVDGQIVLELKAVDALHPVHIAQLRSCLKVSKLRLGLLINFNVALLPQGLKRIVL